MKSKIGITAGDPSGIGAEIIIKAIMGKGIANDIIPIVIGDESVLLDAIKMCGSSMQLNKISDVDKAEDSSDVINLLDMGLLSEEDWKYKKPTVKAGKAAYAYIEKACSLAMIGDIDAVVTCPINKAALNDAGIHYSGHTEIIGALTGTKDFAMLLHSSKMNVIHVTTHVSMADACNMITEERVWKTIDLANESMKLLGYETPSIGVAGFNAHSSEKGLFGNQEGDAIIPAVEKAISKGIKADGPVSPDVVFTRAMAGYYDIVVAMYHDQGHIPFKLSSFQYDVAEDKYTSVDGINCTVGLPIIRTSVDHGTAYDRAGEGRSNEGSLVQAINTAKEMSDNKKKLSVLKKG